ncbi:MAG: hypothetical protein RIQ53_516 [Pseudomonadota bacterium]
MSTTPTVPALPCPPRANDLPALSLTASAAVGVSMLALLALRQPGLAGPPLVALTALLALLHLLASWTLAPHRPQVLAWMAGGPLAIALACWWLPIGDRRALPWLALTVPACLALALWRCRQCRRRNDAAAGALADELHTELDRAWTWVADAQGRLLRGPSWLATDGTTLVAQLQPLHGAALPPAGDDTPRPRLPSASASDPAAPDAPAIGVEPAQRQALHSLALGLRRGLPIRDLLTPLRVSGRDGLWSLSAQPLRDADGRLRGWRGLCVDVTESHARDQALLRLATRDPLTGLANRHGFSGALAHHFASADGRCTTPCTLMMLDLDDFKEVNDSLGHAAGDQLLNEVAQRLRAALPEGALLARLGGDEFALVLTPPPAPPALQAMADGLLQALAQPCPLQDQVLEVHASIGVAHAPQDADTAAQLLHHADLALYDAKAAGRCTWRSFHPRLDAVARDRLALLAQLREALRRDALQLHYQPQIELASGRLVGFEALARWRHPQRGWVPPAEFIALAESARLIEPLGAWVLRQACADAARWPAGLRVAVNLSGLQIERAPVVQQVRDALQASGLAPERLELELTEGSLLRDTDHAVRLLCMLRAQGVRVALDDFGTGFSSLAYLRCFPLDALKLDRSFVAALGQPGEHSAQAIVCAVQSLACALDLALVAEGIETDDQRTLLRDIGCTLGQGWLFAAALPAVEAGHLIERHARAALLGPAPLPLSARPLAPPAVAATTP